MWNGVSDFTVCAERLFERAPALVTTTGPFTSPVSCTSMWPSPTSITFWRFLLISTLAWPLVPKPEPRISMTLPAGALVGK